MMVQLAIAAGASSRGGCYHESVLPLARIHSCWRHLAFSRAADFANKWAAA